MMNIYTTSIRRVRRLRAVMSLTPHNTQRFIQDSKRLAVRNGLNMANKYTLSNNMSTIHKLTRDFREFGTFCPKLSIPSADTPAPETPRFKDLESKNLLNPELLKTITEDLSFDRMTPIQSQTLEPILAHRINCLGQAKTGTGKTLAFLLPSIQTLINKNRTPGTSISLLVISPTRELATQIKQEANQLLKRFPQYKACVAIGGVKKATEMKSISEGCDILVATPGRLLDYLRNTKDFKILLSNLDTLVLDEADRLLDMGFLPDIKSIIGYLPDRAESNRHGMLFSATIANKIEEVANLILGPDYKFFSTIIKGEKLIHEKIPQKLVIAPTFTDMAPALVSHLRTEIEDTGKDNFKAIVFAPTAKLVDFYGRIIKELKDLPVTDILHSRVTQAKRSKAILKFQDTKCGIIVATDIIARGIDISDISHVIQVGAPTDAESYIHRLGRTGRAGADGKGSLIISEHEKFFPEKILTDLKFDVCPVDLRSKEEITILLKNMDDHFRKHVYQAWLGYYKTHAKNMGMTSHELVREANKFVLEGLHASEVPMLTAQTIGKMSLKGTEGLNVKPPPAHKLKKAIRNGDEAAVKKATEQLEKLESMRKEKKRIKQELHRQKYYKVRKTPAEIHDGI